jgi:hypothetical protein
MFLLATSNGEEGSEQNDWDQDANKLFQDLSPLRGQAANFRQRNILIADLTTS